MHDQSSQCQIAYPLRHGLADACAPEEACLCAAEYEASGAYLQRIEAAAKQAAASALQARDTRLN